jgi:hypothetical protein
MALTLGALFEASLLIINAIAVLNEQRFLAKIGWSPADASAGFGPEVGIKHQLIHLISSVQTLLRGFIIVQYFCTIS